MKGVTKGEVCVCIVSDRCWLRASPLCLPLHGSHECTHHHDSCQCCYFRFYPLFTGTLLLALLILSIYRSSYLNIIDRAVQLYESCVTVWLPVLRILTRLLSGSDLEVRILTKKMNNFKYNMLDFFLVLWLFYGRIRTVDRFGSGSATLLPAGLFILMKAYNNRRRWNDNLTDCGALVALLS